MYVGERDTVRVSLTRSRYWLWKFPVYSNHLSRRHLQGEWKEWVDISLETFLKKKKKRGKKVRSLFAVKSQRRLMETGELFSNIDSRRVDTFFHRGNISRSFVSSRVFVCVCLCTIKRTWRKSISVKNFPLIPHISNLRARKTNRA